MSYLSSVQVGGMLGSLIVSTLLPVLVVSVPALVWQLISRRNEPLSSVAALSRKQDARQRIASA